MRKFSTAIAANPRVWMDVTKDGSNAGKVVIELYEDQSPNLAYNFASFFNGLAD